jgi:cytoskeletal protein RodZ
MAVFGDTLRQARAYKGVTLKEAEQATRINRHHLAALEDENFGVLPPLIYQRGIVRNYAAYLDLDPGKLLSMFEEARGGESTAELVAAVKPLDMPSHWAPNFAIIAFLVVMSAIVFAWVYSASFAQNNAPATVASRPLPTVTTVASNPLIADLPSPTAEATPPPAPRQAAAAEVAPEPTAREVTAARPLPTSTPSPTPRAVATERPTTLPTPAAMATTNTVQVAPTVPPPVTEVPAEPVAVLQPEVVEEPTVPAAAESAPRGDQLTISISPTADIYLTVVGDGVPLFDGNLAAGEFAGTWTATQFEVSTSNSEVTMITNYNTGLTFNMPAGLSYFTLP